MNILKITKHGTALTKFHQYLPVFRPVNNATKHASLSEGAFFSQFCGSVRSEQTSKSNLIPLSVLVNNSRGYKIRGHLQLRCKDCYMVRKDGEMYVECASYPRHKQKRMTKRTKYTWILTHAFTSKQRPY